MKLVSDANSELYDPLLHVMSFDVGTLWKACVEAPEMVLKQLRQFTTTCSIPSHGKPHAK